MPFLLTLVAGLVLVGVANGGTRVRYGGAWSRKAVPAREKYVRGLLRSLGRDSDVPGHMVGATATVALDRGESGRVQGPSRRRRTGCEAAARARWVGADPCDMAKASTVL